MRLFNPCALLAIFQHYISHECTTVSDNTPGRRCYTKVNALCFSSICHNNCLDSLTKYRSLLLELPVELVKTQSTTLIVANDGLALIIFTSTVKSDQVLLMPCSILL